jgi:hypothetical protein
MNHPVVASFPTKLPAIIRAAAKRAQTRFWEFFDNNIRKPRTTLAQDK